MSLSGWKYVGAGGLGAASDAVYLWKFLPYGIRERYPPVLPVWTLPCFLFAIPWILTLARTRNRFRVPLATLLGFLMAHIALIVVDCWHDPTNHNLFPFELAFICLATAPAFMAAALNSLTRPMRPELNTREP